MSVLSEAAITLFVLLLFTGGTESSIDSCPASLTRNQFLQEFGDYCFQFIHVEKTWVDARKDCNHRGGDLVQVVDLDFQKFILNTLREVLHWDRHGVWIGATDHDVEQKWMWVTGQVLNWTNWMPGEGPQHTGGFLFAPSHESEDCAQIRLDDTLGRWHDYRCSGVGVHYSYICQYFKPVSTGQATAPIGNGQTTGSATYPPHIPTSGIDMTTNQQIVQTSRPVTSESVKFSTEHLAMSVLQGITLGSKRLQNDEKADD
ncbi:galactose-specific lectin nattectin-like [Mizuhopecten yessoensis]|uniref:Low affinity immunoglobulin epsilon Fc receptor n=1 Tax=Mizuhopecten yessoensis TaxID=6573 RepID=A0A210PX90_MIZYE|nr:galactose-specific lectin nattectin-like [Mizuhopecten yessoensis]OWF41072.1 Low affinity immunoglobulin epsilon Fc receptor [Mizuhopecten yessoensis]